MTKSVLPNFNQVNVLVIGDVMLDRYWYGDTARISPEAPVPVVHVQGVDEKPGGAGNVALNIASLGARCDLIAAAGEDEEADSLAKALQNAGVATHFLRCHSRPTITKLRVISRQQQLMRLDFEEKQTKVDAELAQESLVTKLAKADILLLSDYAKGMLPDPQPYIQAAKAAGIKVLVDPKGRDFARYQGADCITPNRHEFEMIVGPCYNDEEFVTKSEQLMQQHNFAALLITRGEQGMTLLQADQAPLHLPAHARDVFDVTGAGDTVIAVLAAAYATGETLAQATHLANLAAGLVVGRLGAASVSPQDLQQALLRDVEIAEGIVNETDLQKACQLARAKGEKIVFTNGCFDILHSGHVAYLAEAKQQGDRLIVAVNDDNSVKALKGPTRPINSIERRMSVLSGLAAVDWVLPFSDATPERLLELLKPDCLVKGGDYDLSGVVGADIVQNYGGEVKVLAHRPGVSTTQTIADLEVTE